MKKKLIFLMLLVCLLAYSLTFVSCKSASLAGTWELVEGPIWGGGLSYIEFSKDGTAITNGGPVTWKTQNGRMSFTYSGQAPQSVAYKLSGNTLAFTSDNGMILIFRKIN